MKNNENEIAENQFGDKTDSSRSIIVVLLLLATSLTFNGYQYASKEKSLNPTPSSQAMPTSESVVCAPLQQSSSIAVPSSHSSSKSNVPTYKCEESLRVVEQQIVTYEDRLKAVEQKLLKYLPLEEKFKEGTPSPELEAMLRTKIDPLLKNIKNEKLHASIECRGDVCQVDIFRNEGQEYNTVLDSIGSDDSLLSIMSNFTSYIGVPIRDESSNNVTWKHKTIFEINK